MSSLTVILLLWQLHPQRSIDKALAHAQINFFSASAVSMVSGCLGESSVLRLHLAHGGA